MNYNRFILKNGLKVIVVPIKEVESATTLILVGAGSRYETRENNGISHFLEHMAFKGTKKRPTALEIASLIDGIGAEQNAFTGKEYTGYYIKSASNHVDLAFDVLSDMLQNSVLKEEEINRERGVILEEINLYEDTPFRKIGDIYESLLYGDTPMGWDIAGEKENIRKITREDFVSYMKQLYSADNMVLVVAGNVEIESMKSLSEKYFSELPIFKTNSYEKINPSQTDSQILIKHKKTEQAHFALGVRTVSIVDDDEKLKLSILASLLGGGMSSRLFHEIRERRGLAYYVRTLSENFLDSGYLATFAGVDPKRIDEAIKVTVDEYKKLSASPDITQEEVTKAKEFTKGHFVLELEDTKSVAAFYAADELLEKKNENPEEVIEKINKVTLEDVLLVAKKYLGQPLSLAIIGDFDDKERFKKLLA